MSEKVEQLGGSRRTLYDIKETESDKEDEHTSGVLSQHLQDDNEESFRSKKLNQTVNTSI